MMLATSDVHVPQVNKELDSYTGVGSGTEVALYSGEDLFISAGRNHHRQPRTSDTPCLIEHPLVAPGGPARSDRGQRR